MWPAKIAGCKTSSANKTYSSRPTPVKCKSRNPSLGHCIWFQALETTQTKTSKAGD